MESRSPMTRQTGHLNTTSTNCVTLGKSLSFSEPLSFCLQSRGNHADSKELLWGFQGM